MDTDSLYSFFYTKPDLDTWLKNDIWYCPLESLVMPEKLNSFREGIYGHCYDGWQPDYNMHFLNRCCCKKHAQHDQKTPGLFKLEAYGKSMIALCSKTYALELMDGGDKLATITNSQDEARVRVELGMGQLEDYDIYDSDQD